MVHVPLIENKNCTSFCFQTGDKFSNFQPLKHINQYVFCQHNYITIKNFISVSTLFRFRSLSFLYVALSICSMEIEILELALISLKKLQNVNWQNNASNTKIS